MVVLAIAGVAAAAFGFAVGVDFWAWWSSKGRSEVRSKMSGRVK